jgi:hypothetical protein
LKHWPGDRTFSSAMVSAESVSNVTRAASFFFVLASRSEWAKTCTKSVENLSMEFVPWVCVPRLLANNCRS